MYMSKKLKHNKIKNTFLNAVDIKRKKMMEGTMMEMMYELQC